MRQPRRAPSGAPIEQTEYRSGPPIGRYLHPAIKVATGRACLVPSEDMSTTEHTINDALAGVLRETRSVWREPEVITSDTSGLLEKQQAGSGAGVLRESKPAWRGSNAVRSESSGMLKGSHAQPDILIAEPNVSPVIIETEVLPAATVEAEAVARLGEHVRATGRPILSAIAIRLPVRLRASQGRQLRKALLDATDIEMALHTGVGPTECTRWPRSGWITGGVLDLSRLVQSAAVPPAIIDTAADQLVSGVSEAAGLLEEMTASHPSSIHKISKELRQEDGAQTRRMAATILANACVFQESLAGGPGELADVKSLEELRSANGRIGKAAILAEWRRILAVNYWPIFDIARRILELVPAAESGPLIDGLAVTADKLMQTRLMRSHDLTGAVFQRVIADRKFLAAYYTTPASASLLAGLAISPEMPLAGGSWSSADDVKALRVADFACGTGTLLSTAYQRIGQLHELAGGDAEALHSQMMATALVGCDVLPAAAHLTASMLAGAHPTVKYEQSSILTVAYGKQPDGAIALGSLDLLNAQGRFEVLSITAKAHEAMGEAERETWESLPHASFDLVMMNPPFTRATGHEGKKIGVPNPMFAAFSSSAEEQRLMAKATERLTKGTSAHGNAGEASIFLVLADRKLKPGGVLALVMPLSLMSGDAWEDSRVLLSKNYGNLVLISIAGAEDADLAFSADTGMGECLVVAQKSKKGSTRATFVILNERPAFPLLGSSAAEQIRRLIAGQAIRHLEDGPVGGTPLRFGDDVIGHGLDAPLPDAGGWNLSRIADLSLAQSAYQLGNENRAWLPTMRVAEAPSIPITTIGAIGNIGPYHADINGTTASGGVRGPFEIEPVNPKSTPTYPVLWAHDAVRERTMAFDGDSEGITRRGRATAERRAIELKVESIWKSASHCHFNRDFQFNSQSTGMQFTPRKTIGGRAWLSIQLKTVEHEKALVLWANTTPGLLLHWWHANKQQVGRGNIGKAALQTMPVLDVTTLTKSQLDTATKLFAKLQAEELLPLHEMDRDAIRRELDEKFARGVLGWSDSILAPGGPLEVLRMKLSREPSIRGRK